MRINALVKYLSIMTLSSIFISSCSTLHDDSSASAYNQFWFELDGDSNVEPGIRLWTRESDAMWTETYPSGFQASFNEVGRTSVDGVEGTYVVKTSGDEGKTNTTDGEFRVFIPDYTTADGFVYFSRLKDNVWTGWSKSNLLVKPVELRDGTKLGQMPSIK